MKEKVSNSVSVVVSWPVGVANDALGRVSGAASRLPGAGAVRSATERVSGTVSHLPGVGAVRDATGAVLDRLGAVSPRARRAAVYTGAAALTVVGVIEWPLAAGAAGIAWLTQARPEGASVARPGAEPASSDTTSESAGGTASTAKSSGRGAARGGRRRAASTSS